MTSLEGDALAEGQDVPERLHEPMRQALKALLMVMCATPTSW